MGVGSEDGEWDGYGWDSSVSISVKSKDGR